MGERSQFIIASKAHEGSAPDIQSVYYHWLNCEDMILLNRAEKLQVTHDAAFRILGDAEPKHLLTCKELYGLNIL